MKKSKLFVLLVVVMFTLNSAVFPANATSEVSDYSITESFTYTIVPGSSEWAALDTLAQKIEACYVPQEVVAKMTTEALVETVLNYPLLINIYAYNTIEIGIEVVSSYFSGLGELLNRDDAYEILSVYSPDNAARTSNSDIIMIHRNTLLGVLSPASNLGISPRSTSTTVTTPAGSSVSVIAGRTWSDHNSSYSAT